MKYLIISPLLLLLLLLTGCSGYHLHPSDHQIAINTCKENKGVNYFYVTSISLKYLAVICNNGMEGIKKRSTTN